MLRYSVKAKKDRVARMQPPYSLERGGFIKMTSAKDVIEKRHAELKSWEKLSRELDGVNKGTLVGLANGTRKPTRKMIDKLNRFYGCHIHYPPVPVEPLSCGHAPLRKSCPICNQKKYAPHPVMRLSRLRAILTSPYKDS